MPLPPAGLYAITSAAVCADALLLQRAVAAAIEGGAVMLQYRDKLNDARTRQQYALLLQGLCRQAGVPLILNDGPSATVAAYGLDGLHLGEQDGAVTVARRKCPGAIIGATCGNSLERALQAEAAGASYVALGAFHPSRTKPQAGIASPELLLVAKATLSLPICAIGGITPDNAPALIAAGAHYVAAVAGVFDSGDVAQAARRYADLFR